MSIDMRQLRAEYNDLSTPARVILATTAFVEVAAKIAALVDLARRPADKVRGPKWAWALGQAVNGVGPAAYWTFARI